MEKSQSKSPQLSSFKKSFTSDTKDKKSKKDRDEETLKNLKESIPDIDNIFDIHGRIGNGTFSTVFLASIKCDEPKDKRKLFAVKHLIPTSSPNRIVKELKCLVDMGGTDNVVGVNLCLRRNENVAFVMPYLPHDRFQEFYDKMEISEIQSYIKNLLIALRRVHSFNIIHRDVKPSNFLYNRKTGQFMLVDFGLAQNVVESDYNTSKTDLKRKTEDTKSYGDGDTKKNRHEAIKNETTITAAQAHTASNDVKNALFKMPLKQVNDIISLKPSIKNLKTESPLSRDVKRAVLGLSLTSKLQERIRIAQQQKQRQQQQLHSIHQVPANLNNANASTSYDTTKYNTNRPSTSSPSKCYCFGKPQVCNTCLVRKEIPASRAGTPGYRPPEVLLKYTEQTTAVDIWAVGVIFMSILSGVYPFFKATDDFIALAEIVMLFGDESIRKTAYSLERQVTMSRKCKPLNLRKLCVRLKNRSKIDRSEILRKYQSNGKHCEECTNCQQMFYDCLCENTKYKTESIGEDMFPDSAYNFLSKLLEVNPHKRITAELALDHPFLKEKCE